MSPELLNWLGYTASFIVLVSLLMSSIKKLRWINLFGAILFGIYGYLIGSVPTSFMNFGIAIIDIYFLITIYSNKTYLKVLPISNDEAYLDAFLQFYQSDIQTYSNIQMEDIKQAPIKFYVLRDMNPAGLFICKEANANTLTITLDYVIPKYRDFKIGDYVFSSQREIFLKLGYETFEVITENKEHIRYLIKMGFKLKEGKYTKNI